MTLTEFLLARIAEDESVAREVKAIDGDATTGSELFTNDHHHYGFNVGYSATRALAECEAKRRIVEEFTRIGQLPTVGLRDGGGAAMAVMDGLEIAMRAFALPYADHAEYNQAWGF